MRRPLIAFLVLVLLLAVGALVADRLLHARAEERVADEIGAYLDVDGEPAVTIEGFPFLTQLVAGELSSVRATMDAVVVDGVELVDVAAGARGVGVEQPSTVADLELVGTLPDSALQALVDERLQQGDVTVASTTDGLRLGTELLGVELALLADPVVDSGTLSMVVTSLTLGGAQIDASSVAGLVDEDLLTLDLELEVPLGLQVVDAETRDGSLRLTLAGQDVLLEE